MIFFMLSVFKLSFDYTMHIHVYLSLFWFWYGWYLIRNELFEACRLTPYKQNLKSFGKGLLFMPFELLLVQRSHTKVEYFFQYQNLTKQWKQKILRLFFKLFKKFSFAWYVGMPFFWFVLFSYDTIEKCKWIYIMYSLMQIELFNKKNRGFIVHLNKKDYADFLTLHWLIARCALIFIKMNNGKDKHHYDSLIQ